MSLRLAVVGRPVAHSLSPLLHTGWLADAGLAGTYTPIDVDPRDVSGVVARLRGLDGANVTVPLKTTLMSRLDVLSQSAIRAGAVNTVVHSGGRLVGSNTDGVGFLAEAEALGAEPTRPAVVLGAGGAARAVAAALLDGGWQVTVLNRSLRRAGALAEALEGGVRVDTLAALPAALDGAGLVACCVSGAGAPAVAALSVARLATDAVWIDLNYWMEDPPHLAALESRGVRTGDGLRMLVHQGAAAFEAFTGCTPDTDLGLARLRAARGAGRPGVGDWSGPDALG